MKALRHIASVAIVSAASAVFLPGCGSDMPTQIPSDASLKSEGQGRLTFTAPDDGMVYLYDAHSDRLMYSGKVNRGQVLSVDVDNDRLMLDNKMLMEERLPRANERRIYFEPTKGERTLIREERIERTR